MKQRKWMACCAAAVALLTGTAVYAVFRPDTYISQLVLKACGTDAAGPGAFSGLPEGVLLFIKNYLCDMLWAFALTLTMFLIFDAKEDGLKTALLCAAFEVVTELFQKAGLLSGTFDGWDIAAELAVTALTALFIIKRRLIES